MLVDLDNRIKYDRWKRSEYVEGHDRCELCGVEFEDQWTPARVDHCHITGMFRGVICNRCNVLLGKFENHDRTSQWEWELLAYEYLTIRG